jgi:20S proteasome alpha/beta subunit
MAVEFADGVVIGADSRTTTGYACCYLIAVDVCEYLFE